MGRYILKRLLQFIPTVIGSIFLLHYLVVLGIQINGNPARAMFGERTPTPAQLQALAEVFNTSDPCLEQTGNPCLGLFWERVSNLVQGELGVNFQRIPITELISHALPVTLRLAFLAFVLQVVIGLSTGVIAGLRGEGVVDYLVKVSTVLFISVPVFVLGRLVQVYLGVEFGGVFRDSSWAPDWLTALFGVRYTPDHPWASLILPAVVLAALGLATTARLTRTSLMENLRADYVRTAIAKGLPRRRVIGVHALRNSLIPVITDLGYQIGVLMSGAVVTETIFNIPGIGGLVINGVRQQDASVIIPVVTFLVLVYLVINLLVDLLYAVLDPRIRYE